MLISFCFLFCFDLHWTICQRVHTTSSSLEQTA